ncbi:DUF2262 domain-containing protein [uncultured Cardiobacterium sp.]|uniref:DUF2262 domain-containing protein n=1 Tax=uncultured Cardiobacterium sp. TaxID=417619 RepID=UPI002631E264|nr:DUF2262 domain-containing protein [uncultured Cardiobacterium sp.]
MTPQEQRTAFAADYRDEEQDITVLTANPCNAVFSISGAPLYRAKCRILAYRSGQQLHSEPLVGGFGHIHSLAAPADFSGKKLKRLRRLLCALGGKPPVACLAGHTIYRLRVRAHNTAPHRFMLLRILRAGAPDTALAAMRDAYRHPPVWQEAPPAIPLTLDTAFHHYKGQADWLGQPVCIMLDRDENNPAQPAPAAAATLNRLFDSPDNRRYWNERLINHAARCLAAAGESGGLDAAALARRLRLAELAVGADGAFTAWLDAGDTFNGEPVSLGVTPAGELDDPCIGT